MATRIEICEEWLEVRWELSDLFEKVRTCDESWVLYFETLTRQESAHWKSQFSPKKQKIRLQSAAGKVMPNAFFHNRGLVYQPYVTPKTAVNKEY